jgi:hypothetical protein
LEKFEITGGNSITTAGGYRIHTFSSVGEANFNIRSKLQSSASVLNLQANSLNVEYMILAGGGCGGARHGSSGGGAGGYLTGTTTLSPGPQAVSVGAGAVADFVPGPGGATQGGNSSFTSREVLIAYGGGRGSGYLDTVGENGGCGGGGGGHTGSGGGGIGGAGGPAFGYFWDEYDMGNGRGAQGFPGGIGTSGYPSGHGGVGGPGVSTPIAGGTRGGGGGGASWNPATPDKGGAGGVGGGGAGRGGEAYAPAGNGQDAPGSNTGAGGGGGNANPTRGGSGAPGLVIVRYLT